MVRTDLAYKKKAAPLSTERLDLDNNPGSDLLSHTVTRAVPSAVAGLTSVFGMGTGVTLLLLPPGTFTDHLSSGHLSSVIFRWVPMAMAGWLDGQIIKCGGGTYARRHLARLRVARRRRVSRQSQFHN